MVNLALEAQLKERQARNQLEAILRGVQDGLTVVNRRGEFLYANSVGANLCGFESVEELLSTPPPDVILRYEMFDEGGAPFPLDRLPSRLALAGDTSPAEVIVRFRAKKTGAESWAVVNSRPVFNDQGKVDFAVNIFRDYTRQKRTQDIDRFIAKASWLLSSSLEHETTLKNLTRLAVPQISDWCSVYLFAGDGRLNLTAVAHTDPEKVKYAEDLHRMFPPDLDAPTGLAAVLRTGATEYHPEITEEMITASTNDPKKLRMLREIGFTSYLCVPLRAHGRTLGAIIFVNAESRRRLTDQDVRLAEELADRAALAIENARLYAASQSINRIKDEFLATLSHELRTPLNVIQGHAEILKVEAPDLGELNDSIDAIFRNARIQTQIINDLLDISAIVAGKVAFQARRVDVADVIQSALDSVKTTAEIKGVKIDIDIANELPTLFADPTRLLQVFWNLLSNAVKFTPRGGLVVITARVENSKFVVTVRDSGIGIDGKFLPHVFDRFRQEDASLSRQFGGLGLGLSIVRHLVELHGGTAHVASDGKGKGAQFTVRFPLPSLSLASDDLFPGGPIP